MRRRRLGDSGIEVSEISLGSWLTYEGGIERDQTEACTRRAFDLGINLFDTSNIYGVGAAEEAWGEILSGYDRGSYVLATKVFFPMSDSDSGLSAEQIRKQLDASLKRLRTDYVDLYQCHRADPEWTPEQVRAGLEVPGTAKFVSSQPQYNMIWRAPEAELFPLCAEHGISNIVWSPLAQGVLSGKYLPGEQPPADSRAASDRMGFTIERYLRDDVLDAVQRLVPVAEGAGLTMAQMALAWVLRRDEVASAIVGASRPEQLEQNVTASGLTLSRDVLDAVDAALGDVVVDEPRLAGFAREGVRHR